MNFTDKMIQKVKDAKSKEELLLFAKENGLNLTEENAAEIFNEIHKTNELSDDEISSVSGGASGGSSNELQKGDRVRFIENDGREYYGIIDWVIAPKKVYFIAYTDENFNRTGHGKACGINIKLIEKR